MHKRKMYPDLDGEIMFGNMHYELLQIQEVVKVLKSINTLLKIMNSIKRKINIYSRNDHIDNQEIEKISFYIDKTINCLTLIVKMFTFYSQTPAVVYIKIIYRLLIYTRYYISQINEMNHILKTNLSSDITRIMNLKEVIITNFIEKIMELYHYSPKNIKMN